MQPRPSCKDCGQSQGKLVATAHCACQLECDNLWSCMLTFASFYGTRIGIYLRTSFAPYSQMQGNIGVLIVEYLAIHKVFGWVGAKMSQHTPKSPNLGPIHPKTLWIAISAGGGAAPWLQKRRPTMLLLEYKLKMCVVRQNGLRIMIV